MKYSCLVKIECIKIPDITIFFFFFVHWAPRVSLKHLSDKQIADVHISKLTAEAQIEGGVSQGPQLQALVGPFILPNGALSPPF